MWVTVDENNLYELWDRKPRYDEKTGMWKGSLQITELSKREVPKGLTFKNSPQKVELKIKEK